MKRNLLSVAALGALLLTAGAALGQTPAASTETTKPQKLALVATINGADANREFQSNVQVLQNERQAVLDLNAAYDKEKDAAKKKELKTKLDAALTKLNQDNAAMAKAYGFSLTRNYIMQIETAKIYTYVTDEEAAQIEKQAKDQAEKQAKETKTKK